MKIIAVLILALGSLDLSAGVSLSEGFIRDFGGEKWKVASRYEDAQGMVYQYIPIDESNNQWREKVIVEVFPNGEHSLDDYTKQFHQMMRDDKGRHYRYTIYQDGDDDKTLEWWLVDDHERMRTIGWLRIHSVDKALKVITVQSKNVEDVEAQRRRWIREVQNYDFIPNR